MDRSNVHFFNAVRSALMKHAARDPKGRAPRFGDPRSCPSQGLTSSQGSVQAHEGVRSSC